MDENSDQYDHIALKPCLTGGMVLAGMWMSLVFFYPLIWAWGTGFMLAMLLGLFTAKFILGVHSMLKALGLAPLLGCCWIGLIIRLVNH